MIIIIYTEILNEIKPSDDDRKKILDFSNKLMKIIEDYAKENNIIVECRLVGSVAKKTSLKNKADIDIFISFPLEYSQRELKEYGLMLGKYCIDQVGGDYEKRYASHPYITGLINGLEIDFVPCYKIKDSSQLKSAVDRTILHTDYIQSHLTDDEADEVLLLKKFMTSINTYGANYKVSGFSGYLCELLILKYHSFEEVIKNACNWYDKLKIDLENYGTSKNYNNSLIVIDPTDPNRNVAAALTSQKYYEFIESCRNYMENPSKEYFEDRLIKTTPEELINEFYYRRTKCYVLSFNVPELPTDVIYPQINKTRASFVKLSQLNDFKVLKSNYYITSDNKAHIILEYEVYSLPDIKIHNGPLVYDIEHSRAFKNKYDKVEIKDKHWISYIKREHTKITDLIDVALTSKNNNIIKLGKNIKEEICREYALEEVNKHILKSNYEELEYLFMYLNPNYRLNR